MADGAASPDVFAAIASEVAHLLGLSLVVIWRSVPDRPATVAGAWGDRPHPFQAGTEWTVEERTAAALLPEIGRPTRIEDFGAIGGMVPDAIRATGVRSGCGAAIVVDGEFWGTMGSGVAEGEPLPDDIEDRLAEFTELVATTISNSASRAELARLAEEQAALRRVATLVARESPPGEVFAAVAEELGGLLDVAATRLVRYEPDETATIVGSWGRLAHTVPIGTGPVVVAGRLWGALVVSSRHAELLPTGTEGWICEFAELVATAIANAHARSELAASRARLVAAADEERRRVVRDLHDGAQQRLVHTVITLKLGHRALQDDDEKTPALLTEALEHAEQATAELRELAHGILPAVLVQGGLSAGVDALASRMPIPVVNGVSVGRLPAAVEATAYFVVAEAFTNIAKHARARRAAVTARIEAGALRLQVRDDGVGGARREGNGLLGLADRLAGLDGRLGVHSPPDGGALVVADIPLPA